MVPIDSPNRDCSFSLGSNRIEWQPCQNEQPRFGDSIGTSSTGTQLTGTGAYLSCTNIFKCLIPMRVSFNKLSLLFHIHADLTMEGNIGTSFTIPDFSRKFSCLFSWFSNICGCNSCILYIWNRCCITQFNRSKDVSYLSILKT